MPDFKPQVTTYGVEDHSWLGSEHGTDSTESITLDVSTFTAGTHYPNGYIPSGIALSKLASGKYGPYGGSPSEVQTLTRTSTGGTITLSFDGSPVSATIPATAAGFTAAAVQTALEGLDNINPGDVTVTGSAGGPLTVTFGGRYLGQNVPQLVVDNTSATGGTIVAATGTAGGDTVATAGTLDGFLYVSETVNSGTTVIPTALLTHGKVRVANLPANNGLDAAGQADVAGRIRFI